MSLQDRAKYILPFIQALTEGKKVECRFIGMDRWATIKNVNFDIHYQYRIAETKDSLNWDHVSDDFICHARNEDGGVRLFEEKPTIDPEWGHWVSISSEVSADGFSSLTIGTCDWTESLVFRPGYGEAND